MAKPKMKPKRESESDCCGPMFRTSTDANGVDISCNSHSAHDYEPRYPKNTQMLSTRTDGFLCSSTMDEGIAGGVRQQVLNQVGQRNGTMSFRSLLGREKR